jgi:hypothetical protein
MTRVGVNILLVGFLVMGLGGVAYLLLFFMPSDESSIRAFDTGVLICWGLGAILLLAGGIMAAVGRFTSS